MPVRFGWRIDSIHEITRYTINRIGHTTYEKAKKNGIQLFSMCTIFDLSGQYYPDQSDSSRRKNRNFRILEFSNPINLIIV